MSSCEVLVTQALSSPLVRAMVRGLEEAGCPLNLPRHVVALSLQPRRWVGDKSIDTAYSDWSLHSYDLLHNQVVLCSEKCTNLAKVTTILSHELVHLYDNE